MFLHFFIESRDKDKPLGYWQFVRSSIVSGAQWLKTQAIEGGIQFSAEADSLNAAILGTDVTADSPEFEAFVKAVFGEMTSKAGVKAGVNKA